MMMGWGSGLRGLRIGIRNLSGDLLRIICKKDREGQFNLNKSEGRSEAETSKDYFFSNPIYICIIWSCESIISNTERIFLGDIPG